VCVHDYKNVYNAGNSYGLLVAINSDGSVAAPSVFGYPPSRMGIKA
jgi:hypothetical protein